MSQLLIIEDDPDIVDLVALNISDTGLGLESAADGAEGLRKLQERPYSLLLLDWNLPGLSGIEICRQIRGVDQLLPIIMLTSREEEIDRVTALELGVDDYIVKPFSTRELNARIVALLRRSRIASTNRTLGAPAEGESATLCFGELTIDPGIRRVLRANCEIELSKREFDLLYFLAKSPGRPYTREQILNNIWGYHSTGYQRVVTVCIANLRKKLEIDPNKPVYLETVRGIGYRFALSRTA